MEDLWKVLMGPVGSRGSSVAFSDENQVIWLPTPPAKPDGRGSSLADENGFSDSWLSTTAMVNRF